LEIIVFAPASPEIGGSHAIRMAALANVLTDLDYKVTLFKELNNLANYINQVSKKTVIVIDAPPKSNYNLDFLSKKNLIRIGFEFSGELEVEYNIVPFTFKSLRFRATKTLYSGLEYLILRPEIKQNFLRTKKWELDVVISLGAGDTLDNASKIRRKILSQHRDFDVKIILGKHSGHESSHEQCIIIDPDNFYEIIESADHVVTNAGTTLVESIYLQRNILAWPQNQLELEFALHLQQFYDFELINGDSEDFNLTGDKPISIQSTNFVKKLDAEGAQRVGHLIHDIIRDEMETY
jgi:spore coat polysaccharide biosynthesis predicted glycosyltransferase SpsG